MKIVTKEVLKGMFFSTRAKAFYWNALMMFLAFLINQATTLISQNGLTEPGWIILGMILTQVSKGINNALSKPPLPVNQ